MRGRWRDGFVAVAVAVAAVCGAVAPADAQSRLYRPKFSVIATGVSAVRASGTYGLVTRKRVPRYVLINDQTDRRIDLKRADGCTVRDFASPWILFGSCPNSATLRWGRLYDVVTHHWQPLKCPVCGDSAAWGYRYVLGSHWLWLNYPYGCPGAQYGNACPPPVFVSVPSGAETNWQPTPGLAADLDSATLRHPTCLDLPLGLIGPYAAPEAPDVSGVDWKDKLTVAFHNASSASYTVFLEGCGKQPEIPLFTAQSGAVSWLTSANPHLFTWWLSGHQAQGRFIPTLRSFRIVLPTAPKHQTGIYPDSFTLTSKKIYVLDASGRLWSAKLPTSK